MAIAEADATATEFEKLVRIFVDTNVDTHFIVSVLRTTTVKDLRGLIGFLFFLFLCGEFERRVECFEATVPFAALGGFVSIFFCFVSAE